MTSSSTPSPPTGSGRELLRHTMATLAYRGRKVLSGVPAEFSSFNCGSGCRSAGAVLAHVDDLIDWGLSMANGKREWHNSEPQSWSGDVERFHRALAAFDEYLTSDQSLHCSVEKLFQGPVADALTHIGQLAMMRRLAGAPVKAENYFKADITAGRVGADQAAPRLEF